MVEAELFSAMYNDPKHNTFSQARAFIFAAFFVRGSEVAGRSERWRHLFHRR